MLLDINVLTYNPLRVAEVWMDDYRFLSSILHFLSTTSLDPFYPLQIPVLRPVRALGQASLGSSRALWRRLGEANTQGEAAVPLFPMVLLSINILKYQDINGLLLYILCTESINRCFEKTCSPHCLKK